ncbi:hypothetical protein YC2023_001980 [Brassica napus]
MAAYVEIATLHHRRAHLRLSNRRFMYYRNSYQRKNHLDMKKKEDWILFQSFQLLSRVHFLLLHSHQAFKFSFSDNRCAVDDDLEERPGLMKPMISSKKLRKLGFQYKYGIEEIIHQQLMLL